MHNFLMESTLVLSGVAHK